jgi:exodeoxyribonuclease VII large subunit
MNKSFTLSAVLNRIKDIIDEKTIGKRFWLRAEISDIIFNQSSGHCYVDLVETKDNKTIAKCNATIWNSSLSIIKSDLKSDFSNILKKGNEFLCLAEINFHQLHGLKINISKIDISFNLGNLEKRKQETIDKLKKEGVFDNNKSKVPPIVIKKIALIASKSTNGYEDFYKQITQNKYGYVFEIFDFQATVQGENAVKEICQRLEELNTKKYDIVAIIRGGGSKLDLDIFNHYDLAKAIALHHLPIYTGIGHELDTCVADMVASKSHKTPTALGAYIVEQAYNYEIKINTTWASINELQKRYFENQKYSLRLNMQELKSHSINITKLRRGDLHTIMTRINTEVINTINLEKRNLTISKETITSMPIFLLSNQKQSLQNSIQLIQLNFQNKIKLAINNNNFIVQCILTLAKNQCTEKLKNLTTMIEAIKLYHPHNIMKKGYAIPRYKGYLYDNQSLKTNEILEIELYQQTLIVSYIKSKENGKYHL